MKVIDATDLIAGRLATRVAKMALLGEEVVVVNSEKAIITGKKESVFAKYKNLSEKGVPKKGPFLHRMPDKLLRRIIRGMLPYKKPRGKDAFGRIKCYVGLPEKLKDAHLETFKEANISKVPSLKYTYILSISRKLGAKI